MDVLKMNKGDVIPKGCKYHTANGNVYNEGKILTCEAEEDDAFYTNDYIYNLNVYENEYYWVVHVLDRTKKSYEPLYSYINGVPVKCLFNTYTDCKNMEFAPEIPDTVESLTCTYINCVSLKEAPIIPKSVLYMDATFDGCTFCL